MTYEEYLKELEYLQESFNLKKQAIQKKFAIQNNPFKIGDIITNSSIIIKIEKIKIYIDILDKPACIYIGIRLKKDLTPFKNKQIERLYQNNNELKKLGNNLQ